MFLNHLFTVIPFVIFIQLLAYVLYLNWRSLPHRLLAIILTILAFSSGCDYAYVVTHNAQFLQSYFKVIEILWEMLSPLFFHLILSLFEIKLKKYLYILIYLLPVPSSINVLLEKDLLSVNNHNLWGWKFESNFESILFWYSILIPFTILTIFAYLLLNSDKVKTNYRIQKQASIMKKAFIIASILMYIPWNLSKIFNFTNYPVFQNIGAVIITSSIVYGMSQYRQQSLKTSKMLTDFMEHISGFILIMSPEGKILSVNNNCISITGYGKQELEDRYINFILNDNILLSDELKKISKKINYSPNIEVEIKTKDGKIIPVKTGVNAIRNKFDEIMGYYLIFYGSSSEMKQLDVLQSKYELTNREKDVALLLAKGMSNQEIADNLFVSLATVKSHTHNIYQKTNTKNKSELRNLLQ